MSRVSKGARLAVAAALVASVLCVVSLARLAALPSVASILAPREQPVAPRLAIATDEGLLVIAADSAFLITPSLERMPFAWPAGAHVDLILSSAWNAGRLALICRQGREDKVLDVSIAGARVTEVGMPMRVKPLAVHRAGTGFHLYYLDGMHLIRASLDQPYFADPWRVGLAYNIHLDAIEGMVFTDGTPLLIVGERGAHWLIDFSGQIHPMPAGATALWSASHIPSAVALRGARVPFLDEEGVAHAFSSGLGYGAFTVEENGELLALPIAHGVDEPGVIETSQHARRLELRTRRHRLYASSPAHVAWRAVASTTTPYEFAAFPIGDRYLALSEEGREAVLLDAGGQRLSPTSAAATVEALTGRPIDQWLALLGLLGLLTLALPLLVLRAARALRILDERAPRVDEPGARGLFTGILRVPPGAVLHTDSSGHTALHAAGTTLDLSSCPRRHDFDAHTPLVDGDPVYLVGQIETDTAGGPMRATLRKRLHATRGRYLIGRGTAADFARHLTTRANAALYRFALLHLALALTLLGLLALRPFV